MIRRALLISILLLVVSPSAFTQGVFEGDSSASASTLSFITQPTANFGGSKRVWVAIWGCENNGHRIPDSMSFGWDGAGATEALRNGKTVPVTDSIASNTSGFLQGIGVAYILESDIAARNSDTIRVWATGSTGSVKEFFWCGIFSGIDQTEADFAHVSDTSMDGSTNPLTAAISRDAAAVVIGGYTEGAGSTWSWNNSFTESSDDLFSGASMTTGYLITSSGSSSTISATGTIPNRIAMVGISFSVDGAAPPATTGRVIMIMND